MAKITLNLLDNGIDYIYEAVRPMLKIPSNSNHSWKYSVLHLYSGIELLLKEKLRREHWSLIFYDIGEASFEKIENGDDFVSVYHQDLIKRLKNILKVNFKKDGPINNLRKLRNKFEHFEVNISLNEIQEIVIAALEETIIFWEEHLEKGSSDQQKEQFSIIKSVLVEFEVYKNQKLKEFGQVIKEIDKSKNGLILICTDCLSLSFAVFKDDEKDCKCFVCNVRYKKEDYLKHIKSLEESRELSFLFMDNPYDRICPLCQKETLIKYKLTDEISLYQCLNCLNTKDLNPDLTERLFNKNSLEEFFKFVAYHSSENNIPIEEGCQMMLDILENVIDSKKSVPPNESDPR